MGSNIFSRKWVGSILYPTQQEANKLVKIEGREGEIIKTKGTLKICTKVSPDLHVVFGLIEVYSAFLEEYWWQIATFPDRL